MPDGEIDWWATNNDPISRYERYLSENNVASTDQMANIAADIKIFLDAEAEWAESQAPPAAESAAYDVFDNRVVPPAFKKKTLER